MDSRCIDGGVLLMDEPFSVELLEDKSRTRRWLAEFALDSDVRLQDEDKGDKSRDKDDEFEDEEFEDEDENIGDFEEEFEEEFDEEFDEEELDDEGDEF